jgi:predicted nucleic acid-binding protein
VQFLDTNILLYAISADPGETAKQQRANIVIDGGAVALSVQVLQEFYVQATRPTRAGHIPHALAVEYIDIWSRFPVQDMTLPLLTAALDIKVRHGFSYWDCAIIAAARALGCAELLTEDLQHDRIVEGVHIINPFL